MIKLKFDSRSPFLPEFIINLFSSTLSIETTNKLAEIVLLEKQNILDNTTKRDFEHDKNWLTGRLWEYNFLDFNYPEVTELKKFIRSSYDKYMYDLGLIPEEKIYIQCWANILYNDGRRIEEHNHSNAHAGAPLEYSYVSGNLSVQTKNTNTYFCHPLFPRNIRRAVPNNNSELILFPSFIMHSTDPCVTDIPRITIAFDLITEKIYNMIDNKNFRELNK